MKRPIFIIIGAIVVLLLIAIWVYMLFFGGQQEKSGVFANLNLGDTSDPSVSISDPATSTDPVVDTTGPERLRQLTTKPVIGYQEIISGTSSPTLVYYAEAGTGHIYSIDLETGEETRVSGTTIPLSRMAAFTPNGNYMMTQSGSGLSSTFSVRASHGSTTADATSITEQVTDFTATADNTFLYLALAGDVSVAKQYYPDTNETETLFTVPFREAAVRWGETAESAHYVYPKPSNRLEGFLYQASGGQLNRLPIAGYGLSAVGNEVSVLYSKQEAGEYQTYVHNLETNTSNKAAVTVLPEKCVYPSADSAILLCGTTGGALGAAVPDAWYQGVTAYADDLLEVSVNQMVATFASNLETESGRQLDLIKLATNDDMVRSYFVNKTDKTLWLLDREERTFNQTTSE